MRSDVPLTDGAAIKILFLGANPAGTTRLGLDREVRDIKARLRATPHSARFEVVEEWAVRVGDLQAALMRHRPQIVHFSGHGGRAAGAGPAPAGHRDLTAEPQVDAKTTTGLIVEDASGNQVRIEAGPLARLFELVGRDVGCVVLNACYSATQAEAIGEHVDNVVGMTDTIADEAAIAFAGAFYEALGFGQSIETAFGLGRNQIDLHGLDDADVPKLRVRAHQDGSRLPAAAAPTRASVRRELNLALKGDADFDAFCLDYFPDVYRRFSRGMDRVQKVNLLLEQVEAGEIAGRLREA